MSIKDIQFVNWYPYWQGISFKRLNIKHKYIYSWWYGYIINFGFIEIRIWRKGQRPTL